MIGLLVGREIPGANVRSVFADGARNRLRRRSHSAARISACGPSESDHIVQHQDLPVAVRAGADADRGNVQLARDLRRQFARHGFEHDGKRARRFARRAHRAEAARPPRAFCPARGIRRARCSDCGVKPDVAHHRNFRFHQPRDQFHAPLAALDFHGFRARLFDEAHRVAHRDSAAPCDSCRRACRRPAERAALRAARRACGAASRPR